MAGDEGERERALGIQGDSRAKQGRSIRLGLWLYNLGVYSKLYGQVALGIKD